MRKTFEEIIEKQSEDSQFLTPTTQEELVKILQQVREATLKEAAESVWQDSIELIEELDKNSVEVNDN